jgi:hypothetical protein
VPLRKTFLAISASLLLLALPISCTDEGVLHPEEVQLRKKFLAVPLGITEEQLEATLGKPIGRIVYDHSKRCYVYAEQEGNKRLVEIDSGFFGSSTNIPAADFFVERDPSENTLVYSEATVFGYFYFSKNGQLVDKKVVIS